MVKNNKMNSFQLLHYPLAHGLKSMSFLMVQNSKNIEQPIELVVNNLLYKYLIFISLFLGLSCRPGKIIY